MDQFDPPEGTPVPFVLERSYRAMNAEQLIDFLLDEGPR